MLELCFLFLKILCIAVLSILGLILLLLLLVLFVPVRYKSEGSKSTDTMHAQALFTYLNPIVRVKVIFSDKTVVQTKAFGIPVCRTKSKKKTNEEDKENKASKTTAKQNSAQSENQKQKQLDAKSSKKDIILQYASLYAENKELVLEVGRIVFKALKTIRPRDCRAYVTLGTGQADITGYIYAVYCSLQDVLPGEIIFEPVWTEARCEGEYYLKGKIRGIHLLIAIIKIFGNKQVRVLIKKLRSV